MNDTTYNGWTNYETWVTKLWIDNDQGSQEYWQERAEEAAQRAIDEHDGEMVAKDEATETRARLLESEHDESVPETVGVYADLLRHALGMVDWREIARSMLDDLEIDWQPAQDDEAA